MKGTLAKLSVTAGLATATLLSFSGSSVQAATFVVDFDSLSFGEVVDDQFLGLGVDFQGTASVLTIGSGLNEPYPPKSLSNVIYDDPQLGGIIRASSVGGFWSRVGAFVTGLQPVQLRAFDINGVLLGEATTPGPNYTGSGLEPNIFLEVTAQNIAYVNLFGTTFETGNSFTVDDFTFDTDTTAIPTPALLPGLIGMGVAALRKKQGDNVAE
jgi:hypothetical protein